jgi:hypothetical protein
MRNRWHFGPFWVNLGFRPFGFMFHEPWKQPRKEEYIKWLEEYKAEIEDELRAVEREIANLKGEDS